MEKPNFIHLHIHSEYSIIDGLIKIDLLIKKAVEFMMPAVAITDFTNLFGLIKFYMSAHKSGIKPIIGADFLVYNNIFGYETSELTVLARNNIGFKNLKLLISRAYHRGYKNDSPTIDQEWLILHREGLILLSGGRKGDVGKFLLQRNFSKVYRCISFYERYFYNCYYLELVRTNRKDEEKYINFAVELAIKKGLPIVASNDVRFMHTEDFDTHEIRVAIHDGISYYEKKKIGNYSAQQFMRNEDEMRILFSDLPSALTNSVEIAQRCNVTLQLGERFFPKFLNKFTSSKEELISCSFLGLNKRLIFLFPDEQERNKKRLTYEIRLKYELDIINKMGFSGYFLIVKEFVQWSKNQKIPVGPGRGSGSGSLVAYVLMITDIDPLTFDLLFERFLNPERISMPDFDIDFCMEQRDLVIDYVIKTYGRDVVSQIITFGTMAARAAIRDVGRALGFPYSFIDSIAKLIPLDPKMTLEKSFIVEPRLHMLYNTDQSVKNIISMAQKLEGIIRNAGKHAGGIVIAPTKIVDFTPVFYDSEGKNQVTQFDKTDVEHIGLIKFDFLGLRTLTVINKAIIMINKKRRCYKLDDIKILDVKLNDQKSFNMLQTSETTAVFQLESYGMKDLIKRLKPDRFEDIIALLALFRPGPLQSGMVDNFINRKHGLEKISYPDIYCQHELLKPVLESTYGIVLYQEQVMKIAQVLAGYTLSEADILRRAMGEKNPEEMAKQRSIFKLGAIRYGINEKLSMKIFDLVEKFSGYGFNKSHSVAYALISYQTLWLKTHYPAEFMAATMSSDMDNTEKIVLLIRECFRIGLKVLPPDINVSRYHFYVNQSREIVYGIGAIKGVGEGISELIIQARKKHGNFYKLFDLCSNINIKKLNHRILKQLILSGTLDCFGLCRSSLLSSLESSIKTADQYVKTKNSKQQDMFAKIEVQEHSKNSFKDIQKLSEQILIDGEKETLGFYLTGHQLIYNLQRKKNFIKTVLIKNIQFLNHYQTAIVVGIILLVRLTSTKHGDHISICTLDDHSGYLDVIFFKNELNKYKNLLKKDYILAVKGYIGTNTTNSNYKFIAKKILDIKPYIE